MSNLKFKMQRKAAYEAEKLALIFKVGGASLLIAGAAYLLPSLSDAAQQNTERAHEIEKTWEEILPSVKNNQ